MSLKLTLKANEKIIIGGAVIRNGSSRNAEFFVENNVPILRQKDILTEQNANSPARRIYFAVQLMYIDGENRESYLDAFFGMAKELTDVVKSTSPYIAKIAEQIAANQYYHALKTARELIEYEKELIDNA